MTHRVFVVGDADEKTALVKHLASGRGRRILFTRTKHQAKKLAKQLTGAGIPAVDLHGNLSQNARERNLAAFGADADKGGVRVLVATDVAARGVHVDDVELVVHVDPPMEHKSYLHRSGRTARAGAEGIVVTVALDAQRRDVTDLLRKAQITAPLERVTADAATDRRARRRARRAREAGPGRRAAAAALRWRTAPERRRRTAHRRHLRRRARRRIALRRRTLRWSEHGRREHGRRSLRWRRRGCRPLQRRQHRRRSAPPGQRRTAQQQRSPRWWRTARDRRRVRPRWSSN